MKQQAGFIDGELIALGVAIVAIVALGLLVAGAVYWDQQESKRPGFELKKADWVCTLYEPNSTVYVKSGNVLIPIETDGNCAQYTKVKK